MVTRKVKKHEEDLIERLIKKSSDAFIFAIEIDEDICWLNISVQYRFLL